VDFILSLSIQKGWFRQNGKLAFMPYLWWQNSYTNTHGHGIAKVSFVLPEVQDENIS